jgi:hypothetical protein
MQQGLSELEKALAQAGNAPPPEAKPAPIPAPAPTAAPAAAKLCVEVHITNLAPTALAYASWNGSGKSGAWLADKQNQLVAQAAGTGTSKQLAVGEKYVDTLVFEVPPKPYEELHLVLPKSATMSTQSGYWGLAINHEMLFPPAGVGEPAVPSIAATPLVENRPPQETTEPGIVAPATEEAPPAISANQQPAAPEGEPTEDIRDLIRRSVQGDKPPE